MKNSLLFSLAILMATTAFLVNAAQSATPTYTGVVSDSMCIKAHMMPGKTDAECVRECVKHGSKYVLVVGAKVYTLSAKPETLDAFAGKKVDVQGELKDVTLSVQSIHESAKR